MVCLAAGTYPIRSSLYLTRSGKPGAYVTYRGASEGESVLEWATTRAEGEVVITSRTHHIRLKGIVFDGSGSATAGVVCNRLAHHLQVLDSVVKNTGAAGIAVHGCDYAKIDGNQIHHFGYTVGWSSGVTVHLPRWQNRARGFHSFVVNNVISGGVDESSAHSDGNGIIMDRGGDAPPVLIANNLVYMNGGRCIHSYRTSHVWVINNTCYKNGLDRRLLSPPEFTAHKGARGIHFINNIAFAWTNRWPYSVDSTSSASFRRNSQYGGRPSRVPRSVSSRPGRLRTANPLFANPPPVDADADGQWSSAPPPWVIGNAFHLQSASPLIDAGIDPRYAPRVTRPLRRGIRSFLKHDVDGRSRPQGNGFDLGAYEQ
jgi:Right handed beta helix region